MFYFDEIDDKKILKSDLIKNAQAFFTTREICICDKSEIPNPEIENNKKIVTSYLGIEENNLIFPLQTHSANIQIAQENINSYPDTDAIILMNKNQAVFLNFADCTPVILYDEKQNIGAVVHAGWKGTAQSIVSLACKKLIQDFNSNVENITALIGPAICFDCYNVGEEVFAQLQKTVNNFDGLYKIIDDKIYVDLKNINKKQLVELGINKIDICPYCTCCDNGYFYSYRKENRTNLRHSAVLKLV